MRITRILAVALAAFTWLAPASAATGGAPWDKFPAERVTDMAALQRGAKLFVNYCLNCHSASFVRYNRMLEIDGMTEPLIRDNLMFAGEKIGDTMTVAMQPKDAKVWFGAAPPDLSLVARSRAGAQGSGSDYLYTYLRGYFRDPTKVTGWDNTAFPSVAMPHVLWELQGTQEMVPVAGAEPAASGAAHGAAAHPATELKLVKPGQMTKAQYDGAVADLVAYMTWMAEPNQTSRVRLGVFVLLYVALFTLFAWRLSAAYWKDVT